jgi:uncharacterized protein YbbC (DUF1343 family)
MKTHRLLLILIVFLFVSSSLFSQHRGIYPADYSTEEYFPLLATKKLGIVANHSARLNNTHLIDTLLSAKMSIVKIFAPEHGFRGKAGYGEEIKDETDPKTGIPLISLYGKNKKPSIVQLKGIDLMVYDIQDVGVRFYTYISTLHYVMEACAEAEIPLMILDRPNPLGDYFDGPVLKSDFRSFVGMHPIPVVYGLTVGELALMINEEGWLDGEKKCKLTIIKMPGYYHQYAYQIPEAPSPSLPNDLSIRLYASLCFFEGTDFSVGRGTDKAFQVIGYPNPIFGEYSFTPETSSGSIKPIHQDKKCFGSDLSKTSRKETFSLKYLLQYHQLSKGKITFITRPDFFDKLAGTNELREQIMNNWSEDKIRESWNKDLEAYRILRAHYLLYPEKIQECHH